MSPAALRPWRASCMLALTAGSQALDVRRVDLGTLDPAALDHADLSPSDAQHLADRFRVNGDHESALLVLRGELADLVGGPKSELPIVAWLHYHAADAERVLRRFEDALTSLTTSEQLLAQYVDGLDPADFGNETWWDFCELLRCNLLGLRGWVHQNLGALETAQELFDQEQRELDELARSGVDVASARVDADKHVANLAMITGSPERAEELLEARGDTLDPATRAYVLLRLAGAWDERVRREQRGWERPRAAFELALLEPGLLPIDRVFGELWWADLELAAGDADAARGLWGGTEQQLEVLGANGTRARRLWVGVGASLAEGEGERRGWKQTLEHEIDAFLEEWRSLELREGGYGLLHLPDSLRLFCEFTTLARELEGPEAGTRLALERLARAHAESTLARRLGAEAPSVETLRTHLCARAGQGVLLYLAGPVSSWVFALDSSSLDAFELAPSEALEGPRRRLLEELQSSGGRWTDAGRTAARELGAKLLPESVRAKVEGWETLGVCGLDLFQGDIPFELLELGDGRLLGACKAVWRLPPIAASVVLAKRSEQAGTSAAGVRLVAAPKMHPGVVERLELVEFELSSSVIAELLGAYPLDRREVLLGEAASAGALLGSDPVMQFLGHGAYDERRSWSAELVLAPRGEFDEGLVSAGALGESLASEGAPRIALLTACRAARGAQRRGDFGATDLAGTFLTAGTEAVVASPYDLDLALALALSSRFHAALVSGADPAEALRAARAQVAEDPAFADSVQPFLTRAIGFARAPFLVEATPSEVSSGRSRMLWILLTAIGLLVVGALARRRQAAA